MEGSEDQASVCLALAGSVRKAAEQLTGLAQVGSYSSVNLLSKHIDFPVWEVV